MSSDWPFSSCTVLLSVSKRVLAHDLSYGNEFCLHHCCLANQTHFHLKVCAPRSTRFETEVNSSSEMAYYLPGRYYIYTYFTNWRALFWLITWIGFRIVPPITSVHKDLSHSCRVSKRCISCLVLMFLITFDFSNNVISLGNLYIVTLKTNIWGEAELYLQW